MLLAGSATKLLKMLLNIQRAFETWTWQSALHMKHKRTWPLLIGSA